ncbi:MAG: hypothetical protein HN348_03265 [Proteobacteria bacterium]|nr:hypothetical protein [Pseudomonadota bacterium]
MLMKLGLQMALITGFGLMSVVAFADPPKEGEKDEAEKVADDKDEADEAKNEADKSDESAEEEPSKESDDTEDVDGEGDEDDDDDAADDVEGDDGEDVEDGEDAEAEAEPLPPPDPRNIVVINDLHFGLGQMDDGTWDNRDDFRWTRALSTFLDEVLKSGEPTDLVVAGGLLELWQPPADVSCKGPDCSGKQWTAIAKAVVEAHTLDLALIGRFSQQNNNVVYVLPGLHDQALEEDEVWALVNEAMRVEVDEAALELLVPVTFEPEPVEEEPAAEGEEGEGGEEEEDLLADEEDDLLAGEEEEEEVVEEEDPEPEIELGPHMIFRVTDGVWASPDGQVVVDPGQSYVAAAKFAQSLINASENDKPLIDNLRPGAMGAMFAMGSNDDWEDAEQVASVFHDFSLITTPTQRRKGLMDAGTDEEPKWNLKKARKRGHLLYVDLLDPDVPVRPLLLNAEGNRWLNVRNALTQRVASLEDDELLAFCDRMAIHNSIYGARGAYPRCDGYRGTTTRISKGREAWLTKRLEPFGEKYRAMGTYIYGSTHAAEFWSVAMPERSRPVAVYNSGAFQRLFDPLTHRSLTAKLLGKEVVDLTADDLDQTLGSFDLRHLPACYSTVMVRYEDETPTASFKNWYLPKKAETGELLEACDEKCGWVSEQCMD